VRFLFSLVFVDHFLVLGTDVFDGNYAASRPMFWLTLCNWALAAGVPTRIVSFSFSEEPNAEVLTAIRNSDRRLEFFCRDEVSLRRFVRHTGLPATLTADLAFLLLPDTSSTAYQRCRDQVTDSRSRGNAVIGVNFNSLTFSADYSTSVNSCKTSLDAILRRVPSAFVLLIPHDSRFNNMDLAVARDVYRLTDDSLKQRIVLIDSRLHAWDVKAIVGLLDVVVTGRMHLAIAALG